MEKNVVAVIMAGGLGKRMDSNIPKVLHKINDIPMINSILIQLKKLSFIVNLEKIIIVVGKYKEEIKSVIDSLISLPEIVYVTQEVPQGTGHAIMCCKPELLKHIDSDILILSGDVPMLSSYTMESLLNMISNVKFIIATIDDSTGYGKIVLKNNKFYKIVEHKDCTVEELSILQINSGIYCIKSNLLCKYLSYLRNDNNQSEYYLTDIIKIIKDNENIDIDMLEIEKDKLYEIIGINTIKQLNELEELMKNKKIETEYICLI
jgi:UDP-N-acetylglucosamine diphosphorylase/glucosamine-1-phosphate N-acetyltransferase